MNIMTKENYNQAVANNTSKAKIYTTRSTYQKRKRLTRSIVRKWKPNQYSLQLMNPVAQRANLPVAMRITEIDRKQPQVKQSTHQTRTQTEYYRKPNSKITN